MLKIENLQARIEEKEILRGINLDIKPGEVHAIMGPNGSGKSTLASVLAGREDYEVTGGSVDFLGKDLLELSPEDRAKEGLFLAFQYPVEIPGVSTTNFMKTALNEKRKYQGLDLLDAAQFLKLMKEKMKLVQIDQALLSR
jgi:Fe-S cluster assembly ATP-binding protein